MNLGSTMKQIKVIASVYKYAIKQTDESNSNIKYIVNSIGVNKSNFEFDKLKEYRERLYKHALIIIQSFERDQIIFFAEFIREQYCLNEFHERLLDHYMSITEAALEIQKIALNEVCSFRKNANFNRGRLCELLETLFMYETIDNKINYSINNTYSCNFEELFEPLLNEQIESFFDGYDLYFRAEKPEEREVFNKSLNSYLHRKRMTPIEIYIDADNTLYEVLGFTYTDIDKLIINIENKIRQFNRVKNCLYGEHHVKISKNDFGVLFYDIIEPNNMNNIINFLSINNCIKEDPNVNNRKLEVRCFSEDNEMLSFGLCTIKECLIIIKAISFSGHYPDELGISTEKNKMFVKFQQKFSTYFSYLVGDLLQHYGYQLPIKDNGLINVEINRIELKDRNLSFKDIDVLALDIVNKRLYNLELKYYKVKMSYQSIMTDAMENKKFQNFMNRQELIELYKDEILNKLFNIDNALEYTVCPIVITSRVNYNKKQITEYSFEELNKKLINKDIL